ncbi:DinB family protein [bacterium]|nr:DinB family protein [bacterium]
MEGNSAVMQLRTMQDFFNKSISVLDEGDSKYQPHEKAWTVAKQMRHTTMTITWFTDAVFGKGFDMDWEKQFAYIDEAISFDEEKAAFDKAVDDACTAFGVLTEEQLDATIPDNEIMGPMPKRVIVGSITDHTAHHRGALATYARVLGKEPRMPYGE